MFNSANEKKWVVISLRLDVETLQKIDQYCDNRSKFIRDAIDEKIEREEGLFKERLRQERDKLIQRIKEINKILLEEKIREQQERKAQIEREKEIIISAITNYFGYLNRERIEYKLKTQGKEKFKQKLEREFERIAKEMRKDVEDVRKVVLEAFPELKEVEL